MSYTDQETSSEGGEPVELYKFTQSGSSEIYSYTSANIPVTHLGVVYTPQAITRTEITLSPKADSGNIKVTGPRDLPFSQRYLQSLPPLPDILTIFRLHLSDPSLEVVTIFEGDVEAVAFQGSKTIISTSSLMSRLSGVVPKRTFSWMCNHVLYDTQCKANKNNFVSYLTVNSILDNDLDVYDDVIGHPTQTTATSRIAVDPAFFNGGYVKYIDSKGGTHYRTCLLFTQPSTAGIGIVQMNHKILELENTGSASIEIYAGCRHDLGTCKSRFNNVPNYGGFPLIPSDNPFRTGIIV